MPAVVLIAESDPLNLQLLREICEAAGHTVLTAMERAAALASGDRIRVDDLPEKIRAFEDDRILLRSSDESELVPMDELERRYIVNVMKTVGGNKTAAARILGFDRKTLYRKLERYGISAD